MIRTKGEPGTGDIVQAVRHMRKMNSAIAQIKGMREDELLRLQSSYRFLLIWLLMYMKMESFRWLILQLEVWLLLQMQL